MQDETVSELVMLKQVLSFTNGGCSGGDGCGCDGDVDECIGNGQD